MHAPPVSVVTDNEDVYMVPEETQQEAPPVRYSLTPYTPQRLAYPALTSKSYVAASAVPVPSYWDNTMHAPSALDLNGDMLIDDLPTDSVVVFVSTALVSWYFQLPGFLLTYLFHGSHAGRLGSQAGLVLTLIQFGLGTTVLNTFAPPTPDDDAGTMSSSLFGEDGGSQIDNFPNWGSVGANSTADGNVPTEMRMAYAGHEWISFLLMTIGTHCTFLFSPSVVTC